MRTRFFCITVIVVLLVSFALFSCGDDDDDNDDNDDADCINCETTSECTDALGPGWACKNGCCEDLSSDDDDTGTGDDDNDDNDDNDDDDTAPIWQTETVARSAAGNRQTSVKVTDDQAVHIAFTGCTDAPCNRSELVYAVKAAGDEAFEVTSVDAADADTGWFASMQINDAGDIFVVYSNHNRQRQRFAKKLSGGAWITENLGIGDGGWWNGTALCGSDLWMAHTKIPFSGWDNVYLQAGTYDGANWTMQDVDTTSGSGWFNSMAATPTGDPQVAYVLSPAYPVGNLMLAAWTDKGWDIRTIDGNTVGVDLAIDADGYRHLVYSKIDPLNSNLWDLWYATDAPEGTWSKTALDSGDSEEDDTGGFPGIGVDAMGGLHVSYRHFSVGELRYARNVDGEWEFFVADPLGLGMYTDLTVDLDGAVHVTYEDGFNLYHAWCENCAVY
ncbi:MAG: hypothetical protein P9L99_19600 [Candidatus Lernaella stagnicola]|nr:hypothetical protein [Candidatus Lernaella stagnicola]